MEIHLDGHLPKEYAEEFIRMIRNFDDSHQDCHFDLTTNDDTQTLEEVRAVLDHLEADKPFATRREWSKGDA
jgi:hypothetical protein